MSRRSKPRAMFHRLVKLLVGGSLDRLSPCEQELFLAVDKALQATEPTTADPRGDAKDTR